MSGIRLERIKRADGHKLWTSVFPGSRLPGRATQWHRASVAGRQCGWVCYQYRAPNGRRGAEFELVGVAVDPAYRGLNLQMAIHEACIERSHEGGELHCKTYVAATNVASMLNLIECGYYPYDTFREGETVFLKMEAWL